MLWQSFQRDVHTHPTRAFLAPYPKIKGLSLFIFFFRYLIFPRLDLNSLPLLLESMFFFSNLGPFKCLSTLNLIKNCGKFFVHTEILLQLIRTSCIGKKFTLNKGVYRVSSGEQKYLCGFQDWEIQLNIIQAQIKLKNIRTENFQLSVDSFRTMMRTISEQFMNNLRNANNPNSSLSTPYVLAYVYPALQDFINEFAVFAGREVLNFVFVFPSFTYAEF